MAADNTPINEDDDLFQFDGKIEPAVKPASHGAVHAPAAAAAAAAPPAAVPKPTVVRVESLPVVPPATTTPAQIGQVKRVVPAGIEASAPISAAAPVKETGKRQRVTSLTLATLLMATLVNVALVGVVWRSMSGMDDALREVGDHVAHANELAGAPHVEKPGAMHNLSIVAPAPDEGESTLTIASEEISRGEFERARARLYSLLSVIDRFDAKSRAGLASRAQVLTADSYREQADAVEKAATEKAPGFLDVQLEKRQ